MLAALIISTSIAISAIIATLAQAAEIRRLRGLIEPFDRDGDGRPGG
jgi:hypothetical protein